MGFVLCWIFLVLMRSLIGAGSIESRVFTCPLGMWCLSAVRMRLVSSLFEVCTLSGAGVFVCLRELVQSLRRNQSSLLSCNW